MLFTLLKIALQVSCLQLPSFVQYFLREGKWQKLDGDQFY